MTHKETMQANFEAAQKSVDALAQEIAAHRVQRAALLDRGTAAANQIDTLEASVTQSLMTGGDVGKTTMSIAALTAEVAACRTVSAQLDAKIKEAEHSLTIRHNTLNVAQKQVLSAEYQEAAQAYGEGIKALLPLFDKMASIAPGIGASFNPGHGWLIDRGQPFVGNFKIEL